MSWCETDCQITARVLYWTREKTKKNFGDCLSALLLERALVSPQSHADRYRLIGSAIADWLATDDLREVGHSGATLAYWGCGARSEERLNGSANVAYFGVRGPLTRDLLGLPANTPLGDPGLLTPLLHAPRPCPATAGRTLCVPHISEPLAPDEIARRTGADVVLPPVVETFEDMLRLIDAIASSDLVLAGALHAAIVACAYGRPFAFLDIGHVDLPFKWRDFAASIGIEAQFASTIVEAREQAQAMQARLRRPPLAPILGCCPWSIRPSVLLAALLADAAASGDAPEADMTRLTKAAAAMAQNDDAHVVSARASLGKILRSADEAERRGADAERARAAETFELVTRELEQTRNRMRSLIGAGLYRFEPGRDDAQLTFASDQAGAAMLRQGWSPGEVGPIAIADRASIVLPAHTRWFDGRMLLARGWLFAPHRPPFDGRRRVRVHFGGALVLDEVCVNRVADINCDTTLRIPISPQRAALGGDVTIDFEFDNLISPKELGLSNEVRTVAFALWRMWQDA